MNLDHMCENNDPVWVFGYGSLLWKPEFPYSVRETGFISGYKRRFWQGNCTHRGTKDKPGRVVTIVEDSQETVWGVAFKVEGPGKHKALGNLVKREVTLGGYDIICTCFTERDSSTVRTVIVYAATQRSSYYLGDSDLDTMSSEIVDAHGLAGSNVEYVVNLAEYCRNYIPEDNDPHLFGLERRVKELLNMRLLKSVETRTDDEETYLDSDLYDYDKDKNDTDSSSSFESDEGAEEHSLPDSE